MRIFYQSRRDGWILYINTVFYAGLKSACNPTDRFRRDRVAQSFVSGTVHTFGKPCKVSHSVGVIRRTDKVFWIAILVMS